MNVPRPQIELGSKKHLPIVGAIGGWWVMLGLALLVSLLASRYLTLNPVVYFPQQKAVYLAHTVGLMSHIVGPMIALLSQHGS